MRKLTRETTFAKAVLKPLALTSEARSKILNDFCNSVVELENSRATSRVLSKDDVIGLLVGADTVIRSVTHGKASAHRSHNTVGQSQMDQLKLAFGPCLADLVVEYGIGQEGADPIVLGHAHEIIRQNKWFSRNIRGAEMLAEATAKTALSDISKAFVLRVIQLLSERNVEIAADQFSGPSDLLLLEAARFAVGVLRRRIITGVGNTVLGR